MMSGCRVVVVVGSWVGLVCVSGFLTMMRCDGVFISCARMVALLTVVCMYTYTYRVALFTNNVLWE